MCGDDIKYIYTMRMNGDRLEFIVDADTEEGAAIGEEYEIIIVDTMKPLDDTPAVCKKFGARYVNQRLPHFGGTAAGHRAGHRLCQERHPRAGQPADRYPCADARGRHAGADHWPIP